MRCIVLGLLGAAILEAQAARALHVGISGSEPFVVLERGGQAGIAVEIWPLKPVGATNSSSFPAFPTR